MYILTEKLPANLQHQTIQENEESYRKALVKYRRNKKDRTSKHAWFRDDDLGYGPTRIHDPNEVHWWRQQNRGVFRIKEKVLSEHAHKRQRLADRRKYEAVKELAKLLLSYDLIQVNKSSNN